MHHDLDDAAEGVAVALRGLDLGDHGFLGGPVVGAHGARVDRGEIVGTGFGAT